MKYFIYRFSPASIGIQAQKNLSIVCPNKQKENYGLHVTRRLRQTRS